MIGSMKNRIKAMERTYTSSVGPFGTTGGQILTVGDGDFSFSMALAIQIGGPRIIATSLDSYREIVHKYGSARHVIGLRRAGAAIHHEVDCTQLHDVSFPLDTVSECVFNFPHCGGGSTESDVEQNRTLLRQFLTSCVASLQPGTHILVTLRDTPFYTSWDLVGIAGSISSQDGSPITMLETTEADFACLVEYTPQRTHPSQTRALAPDTHRVLCYRFKV